MARMFKQAIELWRKGKNEKGTTLHHRLLLFFMLVSVSLVLIFTLLLVAFGITGKQEHTVQKHLSTEVSVISDKLDEDFGRVSIGGITIAEDISARSDLFFKEKEIKAAELWKHPEIIEELLGRQMQTLISTINNRYCGGVFIMLDATVNPNAKDADFSKAGVFLKKTQPTQTSSVGLDIHCLRGPAQIARDNDIMLIGQWRMEYNIRNQEFFTRVMQTARDNPELPLSRLYYWSGRITLKGNSEAGFLLSVPLRSEDGTVFGLCGIEISDRLFKSFYTPEGGDYESIFTVMAPVCKEGLLMGKGLIAGNNYLTGKHWDFNLVTSDKHDDFVHFSGDKEVYGGKSTEVRLYPKGSPYEDEKWAMAILMPYKVLHTAIDGSKSIFIWIVVLLLAISILSSIYISRRYLKPVNEALDSIRSTNSEERKSTAFTEINDLFDFLASKDKEHEEEVQRLHGEKDAVKTQYEQVQTYITHIADERMPEVDEFEFDVFLKNLHTLTPKEQEIFNMYLEGKKSKEIMEIADINQNTLKYHNKNIYSKLGVTSRKQLLEYASLMKYRKE